LSQRLSEHPRPTTTWKPATRPYVFPAWATPYGQLLIVKLCLFGGTLALAALNRFWLVPSLIRDNKPRGSAAGLFKLRGHILGEQALGLLIILIVSAIGTMEPAMNSSQQGKRSMSVDRILGCCESAFVRR
jgi:hypothetical protein